MRGARMVMLLLITKVPESCSVCGRNFKKEIVLCAVVIDKHISFTGAFSGYRILVKKSKNLGNET